MHLQPEYKKDSSNNEWSNDAQELLGYASEVETEWFCLLKGTNRQSLCDEATVDVLE